MTQKQRDFILCAMANLGYGNHIGPAHQRLGAETSDFGRRVGRWLNGKRGIQAGWIIMQLQYELRTRGLPGGQATIVPAPVDSAK